MAGHDLIMLVLGIFACFMGYSMFRSMLPLWGFLLGGWIGFTLLPLIINDARAASVVYQLGAFAIGGVIGAIISIPLYFVIIFLSGGALGMMLGILAGALIEVGGLGSVRQLTSFTSMSFPPLPQTGLQFILMLIFGLVLGGLAIGFQKFMVCASSAFLGAAAIISGLTGVIFFMANTATGRSAVALVGWMVLALVGLFFQLRMAGEI